jgi:uncharacterized protein
MSIEINKRIAEDFIRGLRTRDGKLLRSIMKEHIVWSLPGKSLMSGEAHGVDAILKRSEILGRYGVSIAVDHVLYGFKDVALSLHNTGQLNGNILDEHLTSVLLLEGEQISRINTYISDVPMLDAYFV